MGPGPGHAAREPVLWNPFANMASLAAGGGPVTIVGGEGSSVFDDTGRAYLDALASLWYCNVGYGRAELADAAASQMRALAAYQVFEHFSNPPAEELAGRVADLSPVPGGKVFFTPGGGSDAVDTAAKLARAYWRAAGQPGKQITIGRAHAYHGMNAYGTSLGGIPANSDAFLPLVSQVEHVAWDDPASLDKTIEQLGPGRVAAFFCEPVIGAGGVYPPPPGYLAAVRKTCRRHDVLFVSDEVITGFGRVGTWFASERFGLDPDLITCAKGLSSGYAPIGAVIVAPRVAEPFWRPGSREVFRHGYTYSAHPAACAVALANLALIEREGLVGRVAGLEPVLAAALAPLAGHDLVAEVRAGTGLLGAVEIAEDARTA
ncbi:MAG TPA: aminotransferase class III-fold pyridoxal phosphate-dependent enzyme, partial [Streptosporangiaceae bacterium]